MSDDSLIDQALATMELAKPVRFGDSIEITPQQALAYSVYLAARDVAKPYGSPAELDKIIRAARGRIPQDEIDAAIAAAERDT